MKFSELYDKQIEFQSSIIDKYDFEIEQLPEDNIKGFSYHLQHLISEVGEVLSADKRWKNLRNGKYNKDEKLDEIADCFIVLMNMAIFSGFESKDVEKAIFNKINKNFVR